MKELRWMWIVPLALPLLGAGSETPFFNNQLEEAASQRGVAARLQQHVANVKLERVPLAIVLRQIETGAGVKITADWQALKAQGVTPTSAITLQETDIPYTDYFEAIAEQLRAEIGIYLAADGSIGFTASSAVSAKRTIAPESTVYRSLVPPRARAVSTSHAKASSTATRHKAVSDPFDTPADAVARGRLETVVKEFAFQRAPLAQVLNSLQAACGASLNINWKALEGAGIAKNSPVTITLSGLPARRALATVLMDVDPAASLGYTIDDGVVMISTRDDLNSAKFQVVRIFDVRDLLRPRPDHLDNDTHDDLVKELVDTIKTTVAPESWRDAGGQIGSLREIDSKLIVNQTADNQRAIAALLEQLRDKPLAKKRKLKIENEK